jgi:hypothetical protein
MTAYVLIALKEGKRASPNVQVNILRTSRYSAYVIFMSNRNKLLQMNAF